MPNAMGPWQGASEALSNVTSNAMNYSKMQQEGQHMRATEDIAGRGMALQEKESGPKMEALQADAALGKMKVESFRKEQEALDKPFFLDSIPPDAMQQNKTEIDYYSKILGAPKKDSGGRDFYTMRDIQSLSKMIGASNELQAGKIKANMNGLYLGVQGVHNEMRQMEQEKAGGKWDEKKDAAYKGLQTKEKELNDKYTQQIKMSEGVQAKILEGQAKATATAQEKQPDRTETQRHNLKMEEIGMVKATKAGGKTGGKPPSESNARLLDKSVVDAEAKILSNPDAPETSAYVDFYNKNNPDNSYEKKEVPGKIWGTNPQWVKVPKTGATTSQPKNKSLKPDGKGGFIYK